MSKPRSCLLLLGLLLVGAASQPDALVVGSPVPVIESESAEAKTSANLAREPSQPPPKPEQQHSVAALAPNPLDAANAAQQKPAQAQVQPQLMLPKTVVADKLRRGLTNFINNLNPAPYFVPNSPQMAGLKQGGAKSASASTTQRETPLIVNDAPSADAVIKGPNRLVQARPLGGPLRWGR